MKISKPKSYSKLPNPLQIFTSTFLGLVIVGAAVIVALNRYMPDLYILIAVWTEANILPFIQEHIPIAPEVTAETLLLTALILSFVFTALYLARTATRGFHNGIWQGENPSKSTLHGSARLLSRPRDLRRTFKTWREGKVPKPGLVVGGIGANKNKLLYDEIKHALVLGGTGAGKTTTCLIPTVVQLIESGTSGIILDPKDELFALTARHAKEAGFKVVSIDFSSAETSDSWLPLQPALDCSQNANGRNKDDLAKEIRILADNLIPDDRKGQPIWPQSARIIFSAIAAFVLESPDIPSDMKNLSTVANLAALSQESLEGIVEKLPPTSQAYQTLKRTMDYPSDTYGGFQVNLNAALNVFAEPNISKMLAKSDFRVEDLVEEKCLLYVRFNSSNKAYDALVAAFINQVMDGLRRLAENRYGGTLPNIIYWILEEFPQVPKIDALQKHISIIRSQGMRLVIAAQDRSQIEAVYGEDAPSIFNNLDTELVLKISDAKTAKYYSEDVLGSYTTETKTQSHSKNSQGGSTTTSINYHEAKLFRKEHLMQWSYDIGHLVIKDGQAYACSSPSVSKTFVGKMLGLNGREADAKKQAEMRLPRPVKNQEPAKVWQWEEGRAEEVLNGIAASLADVEDPRYL